ncbi:cytochrome P450 [Cylindrobasidium torrendii FP15055 ss-10]|uniref:Cytochrome P450 n=1 Tax=Cylindrobasidium torrendii FP15055 ss-10 TaxID=1314674 RepID=A0A0D7BAT4_9AGAR|nr:cytochrome P450 [Cylindrobasidium torrendii FP15055 ss-10]
MLPHLHDLHKLYGPVVRVRPNMLHFSKRAAYMDIYKMGTTLTKDPWFYNCFNLPESSFGFLDPRKHRERKEILNPFFHRKAILKLEHVLQETVDHLVDRLGSTPDVPIDCYYAFRAAAMDVITSYFFGQTLGCLDTPGFTHELLVSVSTLIKSFWISKWFPIIGIVLSRLPEWVVVKMDPRLRITFDMRDMLARQIDNFMSNPAAASSNEKHQRPSRNSLLNESQLLVQAGSDTIGIASYVGLFHALNTPRVYRALRAELDAALPDKEQSYTLRQLEELPYLTAYIKEALRVAQGIVSPLPRIAQRDMIIGGYPVPKGTSVAMAAPFVHNDPDIFESPEEFRPERWLTPESAELENSIVAFSRGARQCLGINLAWAEMYLIFGNVFRRLDFEMHNTSIEDFSHTKDFFSPVLRGRHLHALVRPRKE